jgi:hypothetical protein
MRAGFGRLHPRYPHRPAAMPDASASTIDKDLITTLPLVDGSNRERKGYCQKNFERDQLARSKFARRKRRKPRFIAVAKMGTLLMLAEQSTDQSITL